MKLTARDSKSFLAAPARFNSCLIYGPDTGQVRQSVEKIAAAILRDPQDPFCRVDFTGDALADDPARLADELAAMSFTGERRLIVVREPGEKLADVIEESLSLLDDKNYLVLYTGELTPRSRLRLLYEKEKTLAALPCYLDDGDQLETLIRETLRQRDLKPAEGVIAYLAQHLGGDRMMTLSELEKLSLYAAGQETLTLDDAVQVIDESNERTLDDICHAAAGGDMQTLSHCLDRLFLEGTSPVAVIRGMMRYFSRILEIHAHTAQGQSLDQAIKSLRPAVFYKQVNGVKRDAQRWPATRALSVLSALNKGEAEIKLAGDRDQLQCSHLLTQIARAGARA